MAIPTKHRWYVYLVVFALTLVVGRWAGGQDQDPVAAVVSPAAREARVEGSTLMPDVQLDRLAKRVRLEPSGDPFQVRAWEQAANLQQKRAAPPPPPPQAPPLPFAYMGKLVDGDTVTVFLTKQDRNYIVRAGDTVDGTYSVVSVDEERVVLTYLPLKLQQTLSFAAAAEPAVGATPASMGQVTGRQVPPLPSRLAQGEEDEEDANK